MSILTIIKLRKPSRMGRPNLTEVRTSEILDAFEHCVARYGLEGSSLERVADEANMKRSILRHYIGNRDDLVNALAERVVTNFRTGLQAFFTDTAKRDRIGRVLAFLFPKQPSGSTESILVVEALIAAGDRYPNVRQLMLAYVEDLIQQIAKELAAAYPAATNQRRWAVAYGLVSICFNQESLAPLEVPGKYLKAARSSARILVQSLEN
ncbi:MAG: TetR/AcrR family transcriptional regulator [Planctomycetales bacterium]